MKKKMIPIISIAAASIILLIICVYIMVKLLSLPVSLPFMAADNTEYEPYEGLRVAEQWKNVVVYTPKEVPDSIEEIIDTVEVEEKTEEDVIKQFSLVDTNSLKSYIDRNSEVLNNGYEKIFIDKVDLDNTQTGIQSVYGDDVLAVDMINGITMVGINIPYGEGAVAKAKLAIVDNKEQLDLSIVEDLKYWDNVEEHVKRERAILGINSNGYVWDTNGKWATMFGLARRHGETVRKADTKSEVICFSKDGTMSIGTDINEAWNATEYSPTLIKFGETVYVEDENPEGKIRMAQSAVGQTEDGKTLLLVVSGGIYGSDIGATYQEVLEIMERYKAVNASMLSGGSRTVMYWNDRVVTKNEGYKEEGVLIPTALVVKPASLGQNNNDVEE